MFIKALMSITAVGLLLGSPFAGAADQKAKISDSLKACQANCKPHQKRDATAYEGCMLKCNEAEKTKALPEKKK
jgi:hypothetical protein